VTQVLGELPLDVPIDQRAGLIDMNRKRRADRL